MCFCFFALATCVVIFARHNQLEMLQKELKSQQHPTMKLVAIGIGEEDINTIKLLNPDLQRRQRQKRMSLWLMPFGFFAGITFTFIANLDTFAFAGSFGEHLIGGLLGLGSGLMGSFAAAASVSSESEDSIRIVRNRLEEGSWLLLIETAMGIEIPWAILQKARPQALVRLSDS
uniref:Uncharacterized protein n=1 Tax=Paulinella chromatophora TaxID=39717 RepID=B1X596_PAUCH|nr:hypothetical protein PCC_0699 [Paulinella chromatophora]ACB43115.1 hypothetical protein PCC_0699 [Paulinella chromatophora]|eukprot:gb/GEZN01021653.1/.p1 GENE.gb/GEZN01021653.1/~~gb/GEZN01021653.1/.p1  ORF type:complete len:174 (-),score=3.45 gb/GEZN01021653.1/:15-536(-)